MPFIAFVTNKSNKLSITILGCLATSSLLISLPKHNPGHLKTYANKEPFLINVIYIIGR